MSDDNGTPVQPVIDDLDAFSVELFGQSPAAEEPASPSEEVETEVAETDAPVDGDDAPAPEDDTEDEAALDDEDDGDTPEPEPEEKPKPKNRYKERIDELTAARREAERKAYALEERLAKLEKADEPAPQAKPVVADTGPSPDAKNEDGTEKYPLGEFDPNYVRDLTRHTLKTESESLRVEQEQRRVEEEMAAQRAEIQSSWEAKVGPAQERYPDFADKREDIVQTFSGLDHTYGEYLATTIMSMDYGTDVLYYLATHKDEAKKIIESGAARASLALGRLEARFVMDNEDKTNRLKVSNAPAPPARVNKGSNAVKPPVKDDTDDLDAFSDKLFKRGRR